jgi:hypothetical protein
MKSILISSFLVSTALAAPFVARDSTATIQLKTGDGDTSVQATIPLNTIYSTAGRADLIPGPGDCE